MDITLEKDPPLTDDASPTTQRFAALTEATDATYPMLAPAAAVHLAEEDAFDEQILAGLVNL